MAPLQACQHPTSQTALPRPALQVGDSDDEDEGAAGKCTGSAGPSKASRDIGTVQIAANKDVFIQVPADGGKTTR